MRMKSAPSSTVAPTLRNSVAIAAMRSVSLTRQLAMLRSVVVPSANSADHRQRHRRIGDVVAVQVDRREPPRLRRARLHPVRPHFDPGAHLRQRLGETHVALDAVAAHAFDAHRPAADRARAPENTTLTTHRLRHRSRRATDSDCPPPP